MSLTITSIDELKQLAQGKIVELPGWDDETPFVARLKRPSMQVMAANGTIPNSLLGAATELFYGTKKNDSETNIKDMTELQMAVVKASLVEPSVEELEEVGLGLTDQQMIAIFQYSQMGLKGLEEFRKKPASSKGNKSK